MVIDLNTLLIFRQGVFLFVDDMKISSGLFVLDVTCEYVRSVRPNSTPDRSWDERRLIIYKNDGGYAPRTMPTAEQYSALSEQSAEKFS